MLFNSFFRQINQLIWYINVKTIVGNNKPTKIDKIKSTGLFPKIDIIIPTNPKTIKPVPGKARITKIKALNQELG
ncbi:hypothetical protein NCWK1_1528 [Nostoc cycadae WK-1]|uniref:Uncharacterized protein n=1 Tax=Nostoc cycadae WK-1 TaxID=1861711 RepID=A0A2H6LEY6_9NOSO|nr:hypothetical protein NCWK1_1528 [Nostoc cycadae WK-1]